jgi:hypothetical protein
MQKPLQSSRIRWLAGSAAVCLGLVLVGDRMVARLVAGKLAHRLACAAELSTEPAVTMGGYPFLTQTISGHYRSIDVVATGLHRGDVTVGRVEAEVHDVELPDGDRPATVGSLAASATIGFSTLPTELNGRPVTYAATADGRLTVSTTTAFNGLEIPVTVISRPRLDDGELTMKPDEIEILGFRRSLDGQGAGLMGRLGGLGGLTGPGSSGVARRTLPELPAGLHYRSVSATENGLDIGIEGRDLNLGAVTKAPTSATGSCGTPA